MAGPRREQPEPGGVPAAALALIVHLALFAVLFFGLRWQVKKPEPVSAEIWTQLPSVPPPQPAPPPPAPPPPPPEPPKPVEPPPPKPVPVEPPKPAPDIALQKEKEKKQKEKEQREREEKEKEKQKQEKLAKEKEEKLKQEKLAKEREEKLAEVRRSAEEELQREAAREDARARELARQKAEREARETAARAAAEAATAQARAAWYDRIRAKVRANVVLPDNIAGNPEAVFNVTLLPTGEILNATLVKSSGNKQYDDAVIRAIEKSSPLPLPERREMFERNLPPLRFRPKE